MTTINPTMRCVVCQGEAQSDRARCAPCEGRSVHTDDGLARSFTKADAEKNALDLLPFKALEAIGRVLTFGRKKYAAHQWRNVDARSRYLAAALRHLFAYGRGEDIDPETGGLHLSHAGCCVLFLIECELDGLGVDDRPKVKTTTTQ